MAINDSGQIVGDGVAPSGDYDAFLLTPVPEPSTIALLLASAACLLGYAWRRRRVRQFVVCRSGVAGPHCQRCPRRRVQHAQRRGEPSFRHRGDAGNARIRRPARYGSVGYAYQIGKYDVTVSQYCQFLNAVAKTDTYGLYNSNMANTYESDPTISITHSGSSGNYSYTVTGSDPHAANCPIFDVTWGNAARFCNWLQNGQPPARAGRGLRRRPGRTPQRCCHRCRVDGDKPQFRGDLLHPVGKRMVQGGLLQPDNGTYWAYPTQSNTAPSNVLSAAGTNNANYYCKHGLFTDSIDYLTPVGVVFRVAGALMARSTWVAMFGSGTRQAVTSSRGLRGGTLCSLRRLLGLVRRG